MRILRPIVEAATDLVPIGVADLFHRRGMRAKRFSDDAARPAVLLHNPLEQLQRRAIPYSGASVFDAPGVLR